MTNIISCIDGSNYANSVCELTAWAASRTKLDVSLLHVITPHSDLAAKSNLSGSIGIDARTDLLEELTKIDQERGKIEQKKGNLMLDHAESELAKKDITNVIKLHRHGSLVDTISELQTDAELIIIGKRGEHANNATKHLGSNLERVARISRKPLLVATKRVRPIQRFLIAFDGSPSANKIIEYTISNPLLKDLECHILTVEKDEAILNTAKEKLEIAGFNVTAKLGQGSVETCVTQYIEQNRIDLLAIGSYGHSKIHHLILGSTTKELIYLSHVPVLLFSEHYPF